MNDLLKLSSYDYRLPDELIAQIPANPADRSKLLVRESDGNLQDTVFHSLPNEIETDRVMYFNDSKVIRSRMPIIEAKLITKDGREKIFNGEIFFLEEASADSFKAMVFPGDYFPIGGIIFVGDIAFRVDELIYEGRLLSVLDSSKNIWDILDTYGQLPLPPYIEYSKEKEAGYQPIFAEKKGSLAAPTASLHFTDSVVRGLEKNGIEKHTITLHVGLGTFKNIYEEDIRDYVMHSERAEIPVSIFSTIAEIKTSEKYVLAVGTTVTRTMESLPYLWHSVRDIIDLPEETRDFWDSKSQIRDANPLTNISFSPDKKMIFFNSALFIYGEYQFQVVDEIITNFHLPKSTLFILISSFLSLHEAQKIYAHAIENKYRFFSFGDAMYLKCKK